MASISEPFIRRPVGTTLLSIGLFLVGVVAYVFLPVAPLPNVDFPAIWVSATRPGADPSVMASTVAAPLERRLGEIAGIDQITSTSSLGTTVIQLQFAIGRDIDRAARDVQAAINASLGDLPSDLPTLPKFRKANTAAQPVFVLALTSKTLTTSAIYDVADTVLAQRISQVPGVGDVTVSGADQPAVRIALNPVALSNAGIATDDVRQAIVNANPLGPVGIFNGGRQSETLSVNRQMRTAAEFRDIVIKSANGNFVRLSDVAAVDDSVKNVRSIAWFNKQPAVLIQITKQGDANVIDTVDRVKALIPDLQQWLPAGIDVSILVDRTGTIRASVRDMQYTLLATAILVMLVVLVFLRRIAPTLAAGVSVPLALAGTCAGMWFAGYSINNLSLMALAISVGFVVDDAIVMIENMYRNLELGLSPYQAARQGARQIGFTVLSISLSLIAAFAPLIFLGGIIGRLLREFSLTLTFAIVVSTLVSLTVTPMICAYYIKETTSDRATWFDRIIEGSLSRVVAVYARTLRSALDFPFLTMLVFVATIALTVTLYVKTPKGDFPDDDSGFIFGSTRASADISFQSMLQLQQQLADIVMADPTVAGIGSVVGGGGGPGGGASSNRGTMFINLKPPEERNGVSTQSVIDRLRRNLFNVPGIRLFMVAVQDLRAGGRQSDANYQYTLLSSDLDLLQKWVPIVSKRMETVDGVTDISSNRDSPGLQATLSIDRQAASWLGVRVQDINNALNNAFSQRQISII
jgi:multidrug efflux pump